MTVDRSRSRSPSRIVKKTPPSTGERYNPGYRETLRNMFLGPNAEARAYKENDYGNVRYENDPIIYDSDEDEYDPEIYHDDFLLRQNRGNQEFMRRHRLARPKDPREIAEIWRRHEMDEEAKTNGDYFGEDVVMDDPSEPSDFMKQMSSLMRDLGSKDIEEIILDYFKDKTGNRSLRRRSEVFAKPTTRNLVMLNSMVVKLCLHDNWSSIREVYPCLHAFKYHLVDVDMAYEANYPNINIETGVVHGIETVQDFADFALDFIVKTCVPCIDDQSNRCSKSDEKIKKSLELCKKTKCKESRLRLLRFFIHHINKKNNVDDMEVQDMEVEPRSAMNLVPSQPVGLPVAPDLLSQMTTNFNTGMVTTGDGNTDWKYDMNPFLHNSDKMNAIAERAKEALKGEVAKIEVSIHKNHVEDDSLVAAENSLRALTSDGNSVSGVDAIGIMAPVLASKGVNFNLGLDGERIVLKRVIKDGKTYVVDSETHKMIEDNINLMAEDIMNGEMKAMVSLMRKEMIQETPLNISFEGSLDSENRWRNKNIFVVAGKTMKMSTVKDLVGIYNDKTVGPSEPTVFVEDNVQLVADFANVRHLVGEEVSESTQQGQAIMNKIGLNRFNIDAENGDETNRIAVAKAFTEITLEGSKYKHMNEFDQNVAIFLISEDSLENNPSLVEKMSVMVARQIKMDEKLNKVRDSNELGELVSKSKMINKMNRENMEKAASDGSTQSETYQVALRALNGIDQFQNDIIAQMQKNYAADAQSAFDKVAMRDNPRYAKVKEARDALLDENGKLKDNPSKEDLALHKSYKTNHVLATSLRMEGQAKLGKLGKILRVEHNRDGALDLPLSIRGIYKAFWGVENVVKNDAERAVIHANVDAIFAGDQITTLENTDMSSILPYSRDEIFAHEYVPDDLIQQATSPQGKSIFSQVGFFLTGYLIIEYLMGDSSGEHSDDETKKKIVNRNYWKMIIRNSIHILIGGFFFTPVMIMGMISITGFKAKEGVNKILDLLPGGEDKNLDDGPSLKEQLRAAEEENAEIAADKSRTTGRKPRAGAKEAARLLPGRELRNRR